ncbi:MAG: hypothetical protein HYR95_02500 [Candidatus Colwellbacteria bacterium]|nr:hypothetical protein [Candidatus Colwellbacteria bacterium]
MNKLCIFYFAAVGAICLAQPAYAASAEALNAGFVSGIWYSRNPFFVGDQIRIYSAIHNQSQFDLVGKVKFFDGASQIGESDFSIISGRVLEQWADWKVTPGDHSLYVKIVDAKKSVVGKPLESVTLKFDSSGTDQQFADIDTDGDRIGDREDADDDNDGVPDAVEVKQGTDPLKKDTDGDGIPDGQDTYPLKVGAGSVESALPIETATEAKVLRESKESPVEQNAGVTAVKNTGLKVIGTIDSFADSLKKKVEIKEIALRDKIKETVTPTGEKGDESLSQAEIFDSAIEKIVSGQKAGQHIYLAALSAVAFALGNKFIFYPVLLITSFLVIRYLVRFLRPMK